MLSCLFLPPCCSGLDVVSLSLDLSEFQREEEGIQEEANESSHQLVFAVGSRQTLSYLMYLDDNEDDVSLTRLRQTLHCLMQLEDTKNTQQLEDTKDTQQLEDTKDTHSPAFPEVQFSGSEVRETNYHHLNFLVASDGDNASLVTPTARIYKELSMKCHAYGVQEGHGTSVHRILNDAQPPVVDLSAEFAIVLTLPGRDLQTTFHFHPFHLSILVRMNPIWINEPPFITTLSRVASLPTPIGRELQGQYQVAQLSFYTNCMAISYLVSVLWVHQSYQNSFGRAYRSIIPQLYQGTSDECEANQVIGPTSSIALPETYYFVFSEEQNFFLFIIMPFEVIRFNLESSLLIQCLECDVVFPHCGSHLVPLDIQMTQSEDCMKGKLSVAEMQIKEHPVVKEEVSKDLMQLEFQKGELSREVEGLQKLVRELEDNTRMLMALLIATSQGRECMKKKLLLADKQVEGYAALNNEASENLKHLEDELLSSEELFFGLYQVLLKFPKETDWVLCHFCFKRKKVTNEVLGSPDSKKSQMMISSIILLKTALEALPLLWKVLKDAKSLLLQNIFESISGNGKYASIKNRIEEVIEEDVLHTRISFIARTQQCFAVKAGIDGMLDVARKSFCDTSEAIHNLVNKYREEFRLQNLGMPFNNKHGFYLRIPHKDIHGKLPDLFTKVVKHGKNIHCSTLELESLNVRNKSASAECYMRTELCLEELIDAVREDVSILTLLAEILRLLDMIVNSFAHTISVKPADRYSSLQTEEVLSAASPPEQSSLPKYCLTPTPSPIPSSCSKCSGRDPRSSSPYIKWHDNLLYETMPARFITAALTGHAEVTNGSKLVDGNPSSVLPFIEWHGNPLYEIKTTRHRTAALSGHEEVTIDGYPENEEAVDYLGIVHEADNYFAQKVAVGLLDGERLMEACLGRGSISKGVNAKTWFISH